MLSRALVRYARERPPRPHDACELCATAFGGGAHAHVVDLEERRLACACRACALLFTTPGAANGRYRTVPDRVLVDPELVLDDAAWSTLGVPVRLAFVLFSSARARHFGLYPSPAGATEAEVSEEAWDALAARSALLRAIEPDVEALLVRGRRGRAELDAFLVPIDVCYELVALVRTSWKGFDGGEAPARVDAFFEALRARSKDVRTLRRPQGGAR